MFWCLNCTYNVARMEVMDETSCGLIQLKSEGFFCKKNLREDKDGGLILWELKVLFANFLQPTLLDCGLISRKAEVFFAKFSERGTWTAGWFLLRSRVFFVKWPEKDRSGPSTRPSDPADPTAGNGWQRGLLPWPRNEPGFVGRDNLKKAKQKGYF